MISHKPKKIFFVLGISFICILLLIVVIINVHETKKSDESASEYFSVTFYSNDDTVLKIDSVEKNNSANPPVLPEMIYGTVFQKWDSDFSNIISDTDVHPICRSAKGIENLFSIPGSYGKSGEQVIMPLQLCGDVMLAGFEMKIEYDDEALRLISVFNEDGGIVYNSESSGEVYINYVSEQNTVADVDICSLKFEILKDKGETPLHLTVNKSYRVDGDIIVKAGFNTIDGTVFIYE